ncbi:collectin-11 [Plakobranchus ocellatus]|uniref:Collectin-11 n=1 Tax=Plakobranchus ocellatus TaxID=259542 RepID=A0AAV3YS27_9GAST|nr:collectin-11 [Plakobranchus ocellatus]
MCDRRCASAQNSLPMFLILLVLISASSAKGASSAINLDVSYTSDPVTQSGSQIIKCSFNGGLTDMETVASLTVFGSKPYGNQGEFDELAEIDVWSQVPKLITKELEDAHVVIRGKTDPKHPNQTYLVMSWNSPTPGYRQFYKCVANGLDSQRRPTSISTSVKVELPSKACFESMSSLASQLLDMSGKLNNTCKADATASISLQVKDLHSKIKALDAKLEQTAAAIPKQFNTLQDNITALEVKLETFQRNQNRHFKMMAIDKESFDLSDMSKSRVYIASKVKAAFNIKAANQACISSGGYLVELDDDEEYQFVYDFVTRIKGSNSFFTGGNDIEKEGHLEYYHSKKAVPSLQQWSRGQPDNYNGKEDCMEIRLNYKALNDAPCTMAGKFVCEVDLYG